MKLVIIEPLGMEQEKLVVDSEVLAEALNEGRT